jgi:hypothetical protein
MILGWTLDFFLFVSSRPCVVKVSRKYDAVLTHTGSFRSIATSRTEEKDSYLTHVSIIH